MGTFCQLSISSAISEQRGSPQFTYGRGIYKALKKVDIPKSFWHEIALDRPVWRGVERCSMANSRCIWPLSVRFHSRLNLF